MQPGGLCLEIGGRTLRVIELLLVFNTPSFLGCASLKDIVNDMVVCESHYRSKL